MKPEAAMIRGSVGEAPEVDDRLQESQTKEEPTEDAKADVYKVLEEVETTVRAAGQDAEADKIAAQRKELPDETIPAAEAQQAEAQQGNTGPPRRKPKKGPSQGVADDLRSNTTGVSAPSQGSLQNTEQQAEVGGTMNSDSASVPASPCPSESSNDYDLWCSRLEEENDNQNVFVKVLNFIF